MADEARGRGRPRCADTDQKILDAALASLARGGYARMSVDAVAAEAGVTKPTLYRRFASKVALATAALAAARDRDFPPETGETRADLLTHLRHFRDGIGRPHGMAMLGTVLAEEEGTPDLLTNYREGLVRPRRRMVRAVLERAQARGEVRADADLDLAVNMLIGSLYAGYLTGEPIAEDWPERATDALLQGLRAPTDARRAEGADGGA